MQDTGQPQSFEDNSLPYDRVMQDTGQPQSFEDYSLPYN